MTISPAVIVVWASSERLTEKVKIVVQSVSKSSLIFILSHSWVIRVSVALEVVVVCLSGISICESGGATGSVEIDSAFALFAVCDAF